MKLPSAAAKVARMKYQLLHTAAITLACLRGIGEFASLQRWRLRERFSRHA